MLLSVLMGFLAAYGLLCGLWVVFGNRLTGYSPCRTLLFPHPGQAEGIICRYRWLRHLGLLRGSIQVVTDERIIQNDPNVEILTTEQYRLRMEQEKDKTDGT